MQDLIFVHGMFQNPKSWSKWAAYFEERGYNCIVPAWPLHEGEPATLRANPSSELGKLSLQQIITAIETTIAQSSNPIIIGHSVGGLIAQILLSRGKIAGAVAISSVAPNRMLDLDWGFLKNSAVITNPLKGDEPVIMDAKTFHSAFANTLSEAEAEQAFEEYATHDSRNVLRDCMGSLGQIDLDKPHAPILLIGGTEDQIIPADLNKKNAEAYKDSASVTVFEEFSGRSHYICGEAGWEDVAECVATWLQDNFAAGRTPTDMPQTAVRG